MTIKRRGRSRFPKRRDPEYLDWIRTLRCIACWGTEQTYPTEPAHVRSRGAGGCDIGNVVPLCTDHHREQHSVGITTFGERYWLNLKKTARALAERYANRTTWMFKGWQTGPCSFVTSGDDAA